MTKKCTWEYQSRCIARLARESLEYYVTLQSEGHRETWTSVLILIFTKFLRLSEERVSEDDDLLLFWFSSLVQILLGWSLSIGGGNRGVRFKTRTTLHPARVSPACRSCISCEQWSKPFHLLNKSILLTIPQAFNLFTSPKHVQTHIHSVQILSLCKIQCCCCCFLFLFFRTQWLRFLNVFSPCLFYSSSPFFQREHISNASHN